MDPIACLWTPKNKSEVVGSYRSSTYRAAYLGGQEKCILSEKLSPFNLLLLWTGLIFFHDSFLWVLPIYRSKCRVLRFDSNELAVPRKMERPTKKRQKAAFLWNKPLYLFCISRADDGTKTFFGPNWLYFSVERLKPSASNIQKRSRAFCGKILLFWHHFYRYLQFHVHRGINMIVIGFSEFGHISTE